MSEAAYAQNMVYEIKTSCSELHKVSAQWRDNPHAVDAMFVVIEARKAARKLYALAEQIEAKRNAALRLDEDVPA